MQHQVNHCQVNEVLRCLGQQFIILAQPPVTREPGKGAFDDPAVRQNLEVLGVGPAPNDLQDGIREFLDPCFQFPRIAAVGPDAFQSGVLKADFLDQFPRPLTVLNPGRVNHHAEDQSEGVHEDVALAALDFLARVVAPLVPPFSPVLTDWLSRIAALGVGARPSCSRSRSWSLS